MPSSDSTTAHLAAEGDRRPRAPPILSWRVPLRDAPKEPPRRAVAIKSESDESWSLSRRTLTLLTDKYARRVYGRLNTAASPFDDEST